MSSRCSPISGTRRASSSARQPSGRICRRTGLSPDQAIGHVRRSACGWNDEPMDLGGAPLRCRHFWVGPGTRKCWITCDDHLSRWHARRPPKTASPSSPASNTAGTAGSSPATNSSASAHRCVRSGGETLRTLRHHGRQVVVAPFPYPAYPNGNRVVSFTRSMTKNDDTSNSGTLAMRVL